MNRRHLLALCLVVVSGCTSSSGGGAGDASTPIPPGGSPTTGTPTGPTTGTPGGMPTGTPGGGPVDPGAPPSVVVSLPSAQVGTAPTPPPNSGGDLIVETDQGLYLLDPPLAGEPTFEGRVRVLLAGKAPPADTVVEVNGVPLVREELPGVPAEFWKVDTGGPQPLVGPGGELAITARTGSSIYTLAMRCPVDFPVLSSTPVGTSVGATGKVKVDWGDADLCENDENPFPTDHYASAMLVSYDPATGAAGRAPYSQRLLADHARDVELEVAGDAPAYLAELRWTGLYAQDGQSRGFCGRVKRLAYAR